MSWFDWILIPAMLAGAVSGVLFGGHNGYVALKNRAPIEMSCEDYLRERPKAAWVRLSQCKPDIDHVAVDVGGDLIVRSQYATGEIRRELVPMRPLAVPRAEPAQLVLIAEHAYLDARFERERLLATEGLVLDRLDFSARQRGALAAFHIGIADDPVVIELGGAPTSLAYAIAQLALGLGALGALRWRYRAWRSDQPPAPPRATVVRG